MSIDEIYELFHRMIQVDDMEQMDKWLEFDFGSLESNIAVLTVSRCVRRRLRNYDSFYNRVAMAVEATGRTAKSVLHGLE